MAQNSWGSEVIDREVLAKITSPEARRLSVDREAARQRMRSILKMKAEGRTAVEIATHFNIGRQRVHQLLKSKFALRVGHEMETDS